MNKLQKQHSTKTGNGHESNAVSSTTSQPYELWASFIEQGLVILVEYIARQNISTTTTEAYHTETSLSKNPDSSPKFKVEINKILNRLLNVITKYLCNSNNERISNSISNSLINLPSIPGSSAMRNRIVSALIYSSNIKLRLNILTGIFILSCYELQYCSSTMLGTTLWSHYYGVSSILNSTVNTNNQVSNSIMHDKSKGGQIFFDLLDQILTRNDENEIKLILQVLHHLSDQKTRLFNFDFQNLKRLVCEQFSLSQAVTKFMDSNEVDKSSDKQIENFTVLIQDESTGNSVKMECPSVKTIIKHSYIIYLFVTKVIMLFESL